MTDMAKQNLSYDSVKPIEKLRQPHLTEKVVLHLPIEFPCKREYERINTTIEGLQDKERHQGRADVIEDEYHDGGGRDDGDDNDGDDDHPDGGRKKVSIEGEEHTSHEKMDHGIAREPRSSESEPKVVGESHSHDQEVEVTREPRSGDPESQIDSGLPSESSGGLKHYSEGRAGDGIIYRNYHGEKVKLDKRGRTYRVGDDGVRITSVESPRIPGGFTPEEWREVIFTCS